jgi:DNA recombination protein RmuC
MMIITLIAGLAIGAAAAALALAPRLVSARAALAGEGARSSARLAALGEAHERLTHEFGALSAEALRANNEQFLALARSEFGTLRAAAGGDLERRQAALGELVAPLRDSLSRVDGRLERLERDRVAARAQLGEQLRALMESNERLRGETGTLIAALRRPHARGRWGEMQLRRVVEMVGMTAHCDFVEQRTVDGEEGTLRPDLIVRLPGGKQVVVDAKAPLQAFLDASDASDEDGRRRHLEAHARLLRDHIRHLSAKAYWSQFDSAPDFVVLFVPGEHFHQAALEVAPDLIEEGVRQHVLIATPMTLITLLRAVAYGWQQERVADSARAIGQLGRELHGRLGSLLARLDRLGRRLSGTVDAYNEAVGTLESRVLPSARRLSAHGVAPDGEELPAPRQVASAPRTLGTAQARTDAR